MPGKVGQIIYDLELESGKVLNLSKLIINETVGLTLPSLKAEFSYPSDKFSDLALGKSLKIQIGDEDLDYKMEFTIVGHQFQLAQNSIQVQIAALYKPEFNIKMRGRVFKKQTSVKALQNILSEYFETNNQAKSTDDSMDWVQLALESDREAALRIWKHSYYNDQNHLLPFIQADGRALLIDYKSVSQKKAMKLGDNEESGSGATIGYSVFNTKSSVMDYLSTFRVLSKELKTAKSEQYDPDYEAIFAIGDAPDPLKEMAARYQVYFQDVTHSSYHQAMAKNAQAFSKLDALRVQVQIKADQTKDLIELAQPIQLQVSQRDELIKTALLELGGRYIVLGRSWLVVPGQPLTQILDLAKDAFAI